jgi:hypothetical protein
MTPKSVNDVHKRGGTVLGTSRGGHDTKKIVDNIQDRGINQVHVCLLVFLQYSPYFRLQRLTKYQCVPCLGVHHRRRWNSEGSV